MFQIVYVQFLFCAFQHAVDRAGTVTLEFEDVSQVHIALT